jgi:hypothetical protein
VADQLVASRVVLSYIDLIFVNSYIDVTSKVSFKISEKFSTGNWNNLFSYNQKIDLKNNKFLYL